MVKIVLPEQALGLLGGVARVKRLNKRRGFCCGDPGNKRSYSLDRVGIYTQFAGTEPDQYGHIERRPCHLTAGSRRDTSFARDCQDIPDGGENSRMEGLIPFCDGVIITIDGQYILDQVVCSET
jgi:hypothetical protein